MKFSKAFCKGYLRDRRQDRHIQLFGHDIHYTGTMLLEGDEGEERYEFIERACFAAWNDTQVTDNDGQYCSRYDEEAEDGVTMMDGKHMEVTYEHHVDNLDWESTRYEVLYRAGWDNVIQPVYSMMPRFNDLFRDSELVFDTTRFGLQEVNSNWRMVRAFHEQPALVTSAAWAAHIWPEYSPPEQLVLAAIYQLGPYGYECNHYGDPHASLYIDNDFSVLAQVLRSFNYMYRNGGVLWGDIGVDQNTRSYMGVDDEIQTGNSGRFKVMYRGGKADRMGCGPMDSTDIGGPTAYQDMKATGVYVHALQALIDEAGYDAPSIDITPTLVPYQDDIRKRIAPW